MKSPRIAIEEIQISSFINELRLAEYDVLAYCLSPIEIAADKLSALIWRALKIDRSSVYDDPTFIRHLHDLSALKYVFLGSKNNFLELASSSFEQDQSKSDRYTGLSLANSLTKALNQIENDPKYKDEYEQYVEAMLYGDKKDVKNFTHSIQTLRDIISEL